MGESVNFQSSRALLMQFAPQYREASSAQKGVLLDTFALATGYHRRYGMWLLNHAEEVLHAPATRVRAITDRKSNMRCSWSGTPPTASAPNALSLFFLPC